MSESATPALRTGAQRADGLIKAPRCRTNTCALWSDAIWVCANSRRREVCKLFSIRYWCTLGKKNSRTTRGWTCRGSSLPRRTRALRNLVCTSSEQSISRSRRRDVRIFLCVQAWCTLGISSCGTVRRSVVSFGSSRGNFLPRPTRAYCDSASNQNEPPLRYDKITV